MFSHVRVEASNDVPPADERTIDVAILDMYHGWPNLGHDSLVHLVREASCDLMPQLRRAGLLVRAVSYEVRRRCMLPEPPGGRFALYLGTGGPGHPDPRLNDGVSAGTQGVRENPAWEAQLFALFDAIRSDKNAALLAVCHTFEVMCRWCGIARPVLRGPSKGGKSSGVKENVLTPEALDHPWFARLAADSSLGRRIRIYDSRYFDMIPETHSGRNGVVRIAHEGLRRNALPEAALTMIEIARDPGGLIPRVFAVNHHPEIVDRARERMILEQKYAEGDVADDWYDERKRMLTQTYPGENSERLLHLTSIYTLVAPLRFYLYRQIRQRSEALGFQLEVHEKEVETFGRRPTVPRVSG
ncbi:MAG: hypothetical protein AB1714_22725 [Acidobacteriota bacterium]